MKTALIVVDMQNDFITGSLAVPGGRRSLCPSCTKILDFYGSMVALTRDWHPADHCSFERYGGAWPAHCVEWTDGAALERVIGIAANAKGNAKIYDKGCHRAREECSGMTLELDTELRFCKIEELHICGLARDYCVQATADEARRMGYKVTILEDLCRAVGK